MSHDSSNVGCRYAAGHFNHVPPTVERALWNFLLQPENIVRLETATLMGRPAVEGIAAPLLAEFGCEVNQQSVKQVVGHMVKQLMQDRGYTVGKSRMRTRSGLFSSGMTFRPKRPAVPDRFNDWLDAQVKSPDGDLDPQKISYVAEQWRVSVFTKWGVAMQRLELGVKLRPIVPPSDYEPVEVCAEKIPEGDRPRFPGIPEDQTSVEAYFRDARLRRGM
jgi:hypothetical protein